jgi:hypothetical protein
MGKFSIRQRSFLVNDGYGLNKDDDQINRRRNSRIQRTFVLDIAHSGDIEEHYGLLNLKDKMTVFKPFHRVRRKRKPNGNQ